MSIRLQPPPAIAEPARAALVHALHEVVRGCRFRTLPELGAHLPGTPSKTRLSELARGTGKFPERREVLDLVRVCAPSQVGQVLGLLAAAQAERSALAAAPGQALGDFAVVATVAQFRDWDALGVHRPITRLSSDKDLSERRDAGGLPTYVLRETDVVDDPRKGLRAALRAAAGSTETETETETGVAVRWVVVIGESTAGKTRAAVEAMRAVLGAWRLLIPYGADSLAALLDQHPSLAHTVVWLDEIDTVLRDPVGVAQLRRLLTEPGPLVVLGTLRSDRERELRGTPGWDLLDRRAQLITLKRRPARVEFERELARARELDDPWIAEALARMGTRYGIAEWLAAGPQLLRELDRARASEIDVERVAVGLVDAAVDCYRAGYTYPVPEPLLTEAVRLYLDNNFAPTPAVVAEALEWARRPLAGATGLLVHRPARGDLAFDYLIGHATQPQAPPVPDQLWEVLARHLTSYTATSVGVAAARNGHARIARTIAHRTNGAAIYFELDDITGLTRLAETGSSDAADRLVDLLVKHGDEVELWRRADAGDWRAADRLAGLLIEQGDETELRRRADAGSRAFAHRLAELLVKRGDEAELWRRADAGDRDAAAGLVGLLVERGDQAGLRRRADAGDRYAADQLFGLLHRERDGERDDETELRRRADAGDRHAARRLVELLDERGDVAELRRRADAGDGYAAKCLAGLLRERGDETELQRRADAGDQHAAFPLARLLFERGDEIELQRRADAGDRHAAWWLVWLLDERGDEVALRRRADIGDEDAADDLSWLLVVRGDEAELLRRRSPQDQATRLGWLRRWLRRV